MNNNILEFNYLSDFFTKNKIITKKSGIVDEIKIADDWVINPSTPTNIAKIVENIWIFRRVLKITLTAK